MKKLLTTLLFSAICQISIAQEITLQKPKRFSTGIETLIMTSPNVISGTDLHEFGIGLYGRYFLSKHIAIKGNVNFTFSENTFGYRTGLKQHGWDLPLMMEYHLSPGKKIRPFFGIGFGFTNQQTQVTYDNNAPYQSHFMENYIQISQGVTFDIGKKLQITQSLFYRYQPDAGRSAIGLSIGLGFKI